MPSVRILYSSFPIEIDIAVLPLRFDLCSGWPGRLCAGHHHSRPAVVLGHHLVREALDLKARAVRGDLEAIMYDDSLCMVHEQSASEATVACEALD